MSGTHDDEYKDEDFLPDEARNDGEAAASADEKEDGESAPKEKQEPVLDVNNISPSKRQAAIDEHHRRALLAKENELRQLEKKINVYRKANAALKKELENFQTNDTLAQLENKVREKQLLIEKLSHENKYLANLQRTQAKRIEELENLKEHFPSKHHSIMEELRICKETYRMYKEREKAADERSIKLHQQVVDLTSKNKALAEKIKQHESQMKAEVQPEQTNSKDEESELTALQAKVNALEKSKRAEKAKYDRVIKTCQEQLDECKREMETFQNQLLEKEKEFRMQVVELKKLKRQLRDLAMDTYTNQQMGQFLAQRGVEQDANKKIPMPPPPTDKRPSRIQKNGSKAVPSE